MIIITFDVILTNLGYAVKYCNISFVFKYHIKINYLFLRLLIFLCSGHEIVDHANVTWVS